LKGSADLPRFLGLQVVRYEVGGDGSVIQPSLLKLYVYDSAKGKTTVKKDSELDRFLRSMKIDDQNVAQVQPFVVKNLMSPLPQLASVSGEPAPYPKLKIPGIEVTEEPADGAVKPAPQQKAMPMGGKIRVPGGDMDRKGPMAPGAAAAGAELETATKRPWKDLPSKELQDRLKGDYNPLDPLPAEDMTAGMQPGMRPGMRPDMDGPPRKFKSRPGMNPMNPMAPNMLKKSRPPMGDYAGSAQNPKDDEDKNGAVAEGDVAKLLVRFIDIDVEVGKTYKYYMQVVVANPNFGKEKEAASQQLARAKELYSEWTYTRPITIPGEHFYYIVDISPKDVQAKILRKGANDFLTELKDDSAPVQIHLWKDVVKNEKGNENIVGDWIIAERLLIRRGEPVGRKDVVCPIPEWNHFKGKLTLAASSKQKRGTVNGIPVNFLVDDPPPLMVDFRGGKHRYYNTHTTANRVQVPDEAAVEALVLAPDGKLILRNSRVDETDRQRARHYDHWVKQLAELVREMSEAASTAQPVGPLRIPGKN
jgi:hypothetical protein